MRTRRRSNAPSVFTVPRRDAASRDARRQLSPTTAPIIQDNESILLDQLRQRYHQHRRPARSFATNNNLADENSPLHQPSPPPVPAFANVPPVTATNIPVPPSPPQRTMNPFSTIADDWLRAAAARANQRRFASHGFIGMKGRREKMEDTIMVVPGFVATPITAYDYFAVFDGHGGKKVAEACRDRLHEVVASEVWQRRALQDPEGPIMWGHAMVGGFEKLDVQIIQELQVMHEGYVGSTAVTLIVGEEWLIVANVGDSRAVLSRNGQALPLSNDHKPDRPDEARRVEASGGLIVDVDCPRVFGVLSTTRAFGDYHLKPCVASVPEILSTNRVEGDEFIILGSDGLWDAVSNDLACRVVRQCLREDEHNKGSPRATCSEAAAVLARLALARGSCDNITVMVVALKSFL